MHRIDPSHAVLWTRIRDEKCGEESTRAYFFSSYSVEAVASFREPLRATAALIFFSVVLHSVIERRKTAMAKPVIQRFVLFA